MLLATILALTLFSSLIASVAPTNVRSPRAQTQQGVYIGREKQVNGTSVNYWYGIPYAQQPIGGLRWMPPQALGMSTDTRFAYIPNACPQKNSFGIFLTESCLTLNVYAPAINTRPWPVYVWIHGGSFTSGAGVEYDAAPFIGVSSNHAIPVVVVTINYRLGLLGFLADQALYEERSGAHNRSTTGNYGILDQMMALDWIKKNIEGFGGNPQEITIGGESAGGASVSILLTSPLVQNGTFQRAIIESGAIWPDAASTLQKAINDSGTVLRVMANCSTVKCLRDLNVEQILLVQKFIGSRSIFGAAATPVIDGYVLNDIMENSYARGNFQRVPLLIGSTTNETSLFTCPLFNGTASVAQAQNFLTATFNTTIVREIFSIYGPITAYVNPLTYLNIVFSDSWAHCGSRRTASAFSTAGLPSYLYTYNHRIPVVAPCLGVAHAAELVMLFPDLLSYLYPSYQFDQPEQKLSISMTLYWANFINASNPNYSGSMTRWDPYSLSADDDFVLDINAQMRKSFYNFTCSRLWDRYAVTNSTGRP